MFRLKTKSDVRSSNDRLQQKNTMDAEDWLNTQASQVINTIRWCVFGRVCDGVGLIAQLALVAMIVSSVVIDNQGLEQVCYLSSGLVILFVFRSICTFYAETAALSAGAQVRQSVRIQLIATINRLGSGFVKTRNSAKISTIVVEQVDALNGYYANYLPQRGTLYILPFIVLAVAFWHDWVVGAILLITGPLIPLFMVLVGFGAEAASRKQLGALQRMSSHFLDRLRGLVTLKLFGQAQREIDRVAEVSDRYRKATMEVLRIAFLSSAVLEFFSAIAVALIAVYVGLSLLGLIDIGPLNSDNYFAALFLLLLAPEYFMPLRQLAVNYHSKAEAIVAAEAIVKILTFQQAQSCHVIASNGGNFQPSVSAAIEFQSVCKTYPNRKKPVLRDLSFKVESGQICALIGPSGAGKSTIISMLLGLEKADSGTIWIRGKKVAPGRHMCRPDIAWLGQRPYLFTTSLRENISMFDPGIEPAHLMNAASAAGVLNFSQHLPEGLDMRVGERGYGLSGGQRQRIALARAFLMQAPILILDEPTSNLDYENAVAILDVLKNMFSGRTIFIASHSDLVIERSDCQVVL